MQVEKLRSLIRESINQYIKEIDEAAEMAATEARISKCEEAIQQRTERLDRVTENEDLKELVSEDKIKEIQNEIKMLERAKKKFEAKKAKMEGKKGKKTNPEQEVTTDAPIDEADVAAEMNMSEETTEEALNESFLKMQKLAGVITETQYNQKKKALVKEASIIDKAKAALGGEIKTPKQFDTEEIDGSKLTPEQKDVKNKVIMVLNDYNKTINDNYYLIELVAKKLIDKGLVISMFDRTGYEAKEFEEGLKKKGLKVSSTKESSTTYMDAGDYQPSPVSTTRVTMTITK